MGFDVYVNAYVRIYAAAVSGMLVGVYKPDIKAIAKMAHMMASESMRLYVNDEITEYLTDEADGFEAAAVQAEARAAGEVPVPLDEVKRRLGMGVE